MWTSTLDLNTKRVVAARLLGLVWPGVYYSNIAPLRVENLPRQSLPLPTWVRVRNRLAGISADDLRLISARGDTRIAAAAIPHRHSAYVGHEVVGEVIEVGDEVKRLGVGDRVALQYNPNCVSAGVQQLCRSCASGNYNLCEYGPLPGPKPAGGGWSEEMLVHEQQLFRVPPTLNDEQAVLLEPAAAAIHAVLRRLPQPDDRILIIGAGAVGLLTLQTLRALVPQAEISVLARHSFQVEQATRMGAAHIIYPQDSYIGIQRVTQARLYHGALGNRTLLGGYDLVYDTIGQRKTLHHALRWTRARATVVLVGISPNMMRLDLTPVWNREIDLLGSSGQGMETWPIGSSEQQSTFSVAAEMIASGQLHPEQLITHHFALPDYRNALMTAANKGHSRATRVVFDYSLQPASVVPTVRASAAARPYRPAAITTQRATRPLLRSNAAYREPADLPVTPLPLFEPDPLIPMQAAPEDQNLPFESESMDDDLEDTLVAMPAIRKPARPEYTEPESPAAPEQPAEAAEAEPAVPTQQDDAVEPEPTASIQQDEVVVAEPEMTISTQQDDAVEPEQPVFEVPETPVNDATPEAASEPEPVAALSEAPEEEATAAEPGEIEQPAADVETSVAEAPPQAEETPPSSDALLPVGKPSSRPRPARSHKKNRRNT
jgi:threonine dehydrogenase-like Zn-dependent dehydrogenase